MTEEIKIDIPPKLGDSTKIDIPPKLGDGMRMDNSKMKSEPRLHSVPEVKISLAELETSPDVSDISDKNKITKYDTVAAKIKKELIAPSFYSEVCCGLYTRTIWKVTGHFFDTFGKILIGAATILTFSSGVYNIPSLAFASGATSTVSMVFTGFGSYALRQANVRTEEINMILHDIGITDINNNAIETTEKADQK